MSTIIIYSSKYGCTADCAAYLKKNLTGDVTAADINLIDTTVDLDKYNTVIVGSSIYIGAVSKKLRSYCKDNFELLRKKRLGIFLCCGFSEQADEYLKANFSQELLDHAETIEIFGGEARMEKMSFPDKLIMKAATKGKYSELKISKEVMNGFTKKINS